MKTTVLIRTVFLVCLGTLGSTVNAASAVAPSAAADEEKLKVLDRPLDINEDAGVLTRVK